MQETQLPLWADLNEKRKHPKTAFAAGNKYRKLAEDNLPILAEALERIVNAFTTDAEISPDMPIVISCETNHAAIQQAKEALQKIS